MFPQLSVPQLSPLQEVVGVQQVVPKHVCPLEQEAVTNDEPTGALGKLDPMAPGKPETSEKVPVQLGKEYTLAGRSVTEVDVQQVQLHSLVVFGHIGHVAA